MLDKMIAIHGLGYVGLTAAIHWARAGWTVIAYDPDINTITRLRDGKPRAGEFLAYLDADVAEFVGTGKIIPTTNFDDILRCQVQSIAVPSESDGEPYMDIVRNVLWRLTEGSNRFDILVESTLAPGTIDSVMGILAEREQDLGFRSLAVCPRRDWFAGRDTHLGVMKRVVGGYNHESTVRAVELLSNVSSDIEPTDYRTAEITKALENALLHAAVALPTELAMNMKHANIAEATRLATTHPRLMKLFLGAGTGGRCIPLGPKYLNALGGPHSMLTEALNVDRHIRLACAQAVAQRGCKTALVLGIAYRPDFKDAGNSPGLDVAHHLQKTYGVQVTVHDPMWRDYELQNMTGFAAPQLDLEPASMAFYDAVVLATPHTRYLDWVGRYLDPLKTLRFVLDCQGVWAHRKHEFVERGVEYAQVGSPGWLK